MESKKITGIYEAYIEVYENILLKDIIEFCLTEEIFDNIDETYYFAEELISQNLVETYVEDLLEFYGIEELLIEGKAQLIAKGLQAAGGLLKKLPAAARGLSTNTALKKGFRPTALSSKGKPLSGAAKSDDIARIQSARASRKPSTGTEKPGKYLDMLQAKKSAQPTTKSSSKLNAVQQTGIVAKAFLKSLEPTAATAAKKMPKGAAADPWKQFPKKPKQQLGIPKSGPSSTLPGRTLAPAGGTTAKPALPASGQTQKGGKLATRSTSTPTAPVGTRSNPERIYPTSIKSTPSKPALPPSGKMNAPALPSGKQPSGTKKPKRGEGLTDTVRAKLSPSEKGGNMKYPGMEKYATTGKEPSIKKPKGSKLGPIAAGAGLVGAGIAGSQEPKEKKPKSVKTNVYNTMDSSGKIRSRAKVGPAKIGDTFEDAFRFYRKRGDKTFKYSGKEYTTKMAEDIITDYLLDEGFASDEKSAQAIVNAMSEVWIESIIEAKVDKKLPEHERSGARLKRYANPSGALALGGGQQRARRSEHEERRGKKKD